MKSNNDCATKELALPLAQPSHLSPPANLCTFEISPVAVWGDWLDDSGCKMWCHERTRMLASLSAWTDVLYRQAVLHYYVKDPNQSKFSQVWSVQTEWRLLHIKPPTPPYISQKQTKTMESHNIKLWGNISMILSLSLTFILFDGKYSNHLMIQLGEFTRQFPDVEMWLIHPHWSFASFR